MKKYFCKRIEKTMVKSHLMKGLLIFLLPFFGLFISCNSGSSSNDDKLSTPTTGNVKIAVDETLKPILDSQIVVFESDYQKAKISKSYIPEGNAINLLLKDSVQLAIICRELTEQEKAFLKTKDYKAITTESARDGIALIVNPSNHDTLLSFEKVISILKGEKKTWNQINNDSKSGKIQLVFDHAMSSTFRFISEKTNIPDLSGENIYAAGDNQKVIEYVSKNKGALGFIGSNWVSDKDDSTAMSFIKQVNIVGISPAKGTKGEGEFLQPYQAYIAQKIYPFTRTIYTVCTEPRAGLATGFAAFLAGNKGQRIYLKSGLVPAKMPIRLIRVSK